MFGRIRHSEFFKNVFTLLKGNVISQILTIAGTLILARVLSVESFGVFALFAGTLSILQPLATGKYEVALPLAKTIFEAKRILILCLKNSLWTSVILLLVLLLVPDVLFERMGVLKLKPYFGLLVVCFFFGGLYATFRYWLVREKSFKTLARAQIAQSVTTVTTRIGGSFILADALALILGYVLGFMVVVGWMLRKSDISKNFTIRKEENSENISRKFRSFPLFSMPFSVLNATSANLLIYVFQITFGTFVVGLYTQCMKVLTLPLNVISASFMNVFYQKITQSNQPKKLYLLSFFSSWILGFLILSPLMIWGSEIFSFVLGGKWAEAGSYAVFLIPLAVAAFATENINDTFGMLLKNHVLLIWEILYLSVSIALLFYLRGQSVQIFLFAFSANGTLFFLALAGIGYWLLGKNK